MEYPVDGKYCTGCGEWRALTDFGISKSSPDGFRNRCVVCAGSVDTYQDEHRERMNDVNKCGVYAITNTETGALYVGATAQSFIARWQAHRSRLQAGTHNSQRLQEDWNRYGSAVFTFTILQVVENRGDVSGCEIAWYERYQAAATYNTSRPVPFRPRYTTLPTRVQLEHHSRAPRAVKGTSWQTAAYSVPVTPSIDTERKRIARELYTSGIAETVIIEIVWQCRRGGGTTYHAAREAFRRAITERSNVQAEPTIELDAIARRLREYGVAEAIIVACFEQPRTELGDRFSETQRIDIAKRLRDAGVAETVVIECVWGVTRGGGKRFVEARETFRKEVIADSTEVVATV